jgi:small-conductance mechanosensitive channel
MFIQDFFNSQSQTTQNYLIASLAILTTYLVLKIFKTLGVSHLKKISRHIPGHYDNFIFDLLEGISNLFYVIVSIAVGLSFLDLYPVVALIRNWAVGIAIFWEVIKAGKKTITFFGDEYLNLQENKKEKTDPAVVGTIQMIAQIGLWVFGLIMLLSNLGYDVTTLIASLGIGGIAVALALQNILGDLFSSLTIYFDKPFKVGDFIVAGTEKGTVEKIGLKTTRIKTPQGQTLVIPNSDLTNSRIENFQLMQKRRISFDMGIAYETPTKKVEQIPEIISNLFVDNDQVELLRCFFKSYGDSALIFEITFNINSKKYDTYVENLHQLNIEIKRAFDKAKIEFAYPTQTIYVKK